MNREREAILTVFFSEIEKVLRKNLIIVLDDYHLIKDSQEINESLEFFLENQPLEVHLVIISRSDPGLSLSKFRARREVLDIREADLSFTLPKVQQFYLQLFDIPLHEESLKILNQKTDGWVSGLILFYHSLKWKNPKEIDELLYKLKGSQRIISDYLEENVYKMHSNEIKNFMIKTSILSCINAVFCNQLLGISNLEDILKYIEEDHLFTLPFDEDRVWYYCHHLFQDFLHRRLHNELIREEVLKLHKNAAVLWEKQGEYEKALRHCIKGNI
ncbi:MAG: hypothetical protein SVZ03_02095 [Spirochaetota bacterium]|nr:hypothetical protein [Spirochaetota bacterium]